MAQQPLYILYLDDYHAGDVHFIQSLARGLGKMQARPAPILVHGSAEHGERFLEANGVFRDRKHGVLQVESADEHALVERGTRQLNQKIVAIFSDAVVSAIGVMGTQRRAVVLEGDVVVAAGAGWLHALMKQGVIPVLGSYARSAEGETTGEVPIAEAVVALAKAFGTEEAVVVFFTKTNLPGVTREGKPLDEITVDDPAVERSVADVAGMKRILAADLPVFLTNTTRFADAEGPVGTHVSSSRNPSPG